MTRTLRSKRLRAMLWEAAGGTCQICGCELDPDNWHADHIIPYKLKPETNVHEMQALCPTCNLQKGDKMQGQQMGFGQAQPLKLRPHQEEFNNAIDSILLGEPVDTIIVNVTPGGGKSLLPVIAAKLIPKLADKICWVVPRESLKLQAEATFDNSKFRDSFPHGHRIRQSTNQTNPSRGSAGFTTTYQAIVADKSVRSVPQEFERQRYILFLDECHHIAKGGEWEQAIAPLVEQAILVIYASGTLERGDDKQIAFLPYIESDGQATLDLSQTATKRVIQYTRKQALSDNAILPTEFHVHDGAASWIDIHGEKCEVESFDDEAGENRNALRSASRTGYALELINEGYDHWAGHRARVYPGAKMLVVAPRIKEAEEYLEYLKKEKQCNAAIAVTQEYETKKSIAKQAKDAIHRFKSGKLNVLVTVGMAYEGLDVPEITHVVCLTIIRSAPWVIQCVERANRVTLGKVRAFTFAPGDKEFKLVQQRMENDQLKAAKVQEEDDDSGGSNPGGDPLPPRERDRIHPLASVLHPGEVIGFGNVVLSPQQVQILKAITREEGFEGHSLINVANLVRKATRELNGAITEQHAPRNTITQSLTQEEESLRAAIQKRASSIDRSQGWEPGTTNGLLLKQFGKRRNEMLVDELHKVVAWLNRYYPASSGEVNEYY